MNYKMEAFNKNLSLVHKPVRVWLFIGVFMVFMQVVIGGITRLTDSGLSITEWAVIQGTLPPTNVAEWEEAFAEYKVMAKKQFETLHADMTLSEFKVIYFWEYFHRLWARTMGFVFLFPFLFFLWKRGSYQRLWKRLGITANAPPKDEEHLRWMPNWTMKWLGIVILLAMLAATFGWIMVASGLNDNTRTWVSAYKLSIHLSIATALFACLTWTWIRASQPAGRDFEYLNLKKWARIITGVLFLQIILGGLMAGMRAGLIHPHFPFFIHGDRLLGTLLETEQANAEGMINYEASVFVKGLVQILHRGTAYLLSGLIIWFYIKSRKIKISSRLQFANNLLLGMLVIQFLLGILTVINSIGRIPLVYGALHQCGALILLGILLFVNFQFRKE